MLLTKEEIIKLSGSDGETIDTAVPQPWFDMVRERQIEPRDYVWSYGGGETPKGETPKNMFGGPVHIGTYLLRAIRKGNLIPASVLPCIVDMAKDGLSLDEITKMVKDHCSQL